MNEFEQLVDAHYQALFRFALSLAKDADRAAGLVRQTFCIRAENRQNPAGRRRGRCFQTGFEG
jgi:RNA polymerase sigma-70 factor (ECF subfamily)